MAKPIELLLLRNIENLGIVGDVVKVKAGYARNYLLPHCYAEFPTPEKIEELKDARAAALAELEALQREREALLERLNDIEVSLTRSCNDQGLLYGSISQRDISEALAEDGYAVEIRAVRLNQPLRRIGSYPVTIQFNKDLKAEITVQVLPDRQLEEFMEDDEETTEEGVAEAEGGEAGDESAAETPETAESAGSAG